MLIDSHSHLYFKDYFPDLDDVVLRALNRGVDGQILVGCGLKESIEAIKCAEKLRTLYGNCYYALIGIHPHDADQYNDIIEEKFKNMVLDFNSSDNKIVVGIGEIGLDYFRNYKPISVQIDAFEKQLIFAKKLNLPVVIHERDAFLDTIKVLNNIKSKNVLFHSFNGGVKEADECLSKGYYLSFSGMITYPKNDYLRDVVKMAPLDKIMVETDCPFLPPQKFRGKRNEPSFVVDVAEEIAFLKEKSLEEISDITTNNVKKFFNL